MTCKNCANTLSSDFSFCPSCGAKVVSKRITAKSLISDFFERYFNLDNTFFKTLWHMLVKPQEVCGGYINGLRKKYLNPVSMLAIALTTSGLILFFMKKVAWGKIDFSKISYAQTSNPQEGTEKIFSASMEYSSLIYFLYIPIITLASYLVFNRKKYNLPEHVIISTYSLTSFSIISTVYAVLLLALSPQMYVDTALIYVVIMILFCIYVAIKNSPCSYASLLWRIPSFLMIVFIGYMGISIFTMIILFLTGDLNIQDFVPKK